MAVSPRINLKTPPKGAGNKNVSVRLTLYTPGITKDIRAQLRARIQQASEGLRDQIKMEISGMTSTPGGPPAQRTEALKGSIKYEAPEGTKMVGLVYQDSEQVPYGPWLEFGLPNRKPGALPAYPYMVPTFLKHKHEMEKKISSIQIRTIKTNAIKIETSR